MFRIISSNRQALELQCRKPLVQVVQVRRNRGQQLLAGCQIRAGQTAVGALRRDVRESPARANESAVRAEDR